MRGHEPVLIPAGVHVPAFVPNAPCPFDCRPLMRVFGPAPFIVLVSGRPENVTMHEPRDSFWPHDGLRRCVTMGSAQEESSPVVGQEPVFVRCKHLRVDSVTDVAQPLDHMHRV